MNIKHIFIISALFLMMGVISSVSAGDWSGTADQFLGNLSTEGCITDNTTITITSSNANVSDNYTINQSNITIKTEGIVTLNGNKTNVGFNITGSNVTIQGITFKNFNNTNTNYGVINWYGNGSIQDCNFTEQKSGNIIYLYNNGNLTIRNSLFKNNKNNPNNHYSINSMNSMYIGNGSVCIEHCKFINVPQSICISSLSSVFIKGCNFTNSNNATPVRLYQSIRVNVTECNFNNITAAIRANKENSRTIFQIDGIKGFESNPSVAYVSNLVFDNCNGNIMSIDVNTSSVKNCRFNNINSDGVMQLFSSLGVVENVTFTNIKNTTNQNVVSALYGDFVVKNLSFTNITTTYGLYLITNGTNISDCVFNNITTEHGVIFITGAVRKNETIWGRNTKLMNVKFVNCTSIAYRYGINVINNNTCNLSLSGGEGAVIYNIGSNASISSTVNIIIQDNKTVNVYNGTNITLYAQITTGSNLNYIIDPNFNFTVKNQNITPEDINDTFYYISDYLVNGNLGDKITVSGTSTINASNIQIMNGVLNIKDNTTLNINTTDVSYGEDLKVTVNVNPNRATGNVTIYINNKKINTTELKNGVAIFNIKGLPVGDYNITAVYEGDDKYLNSTNKSKFSVKKAKPSFKINNVTYDDGMIIISSNTTINGNITITINGETKIVPIVNGNGSLNITDWGLSAGDYTALINFTGNDNYTSTTTRVNFTINKSKTITDITITKNGDDSVVIHLNLTDSQGNPLNGVVEVNVTYPDGKVNLFNVTILSGKGNITLNSLPNGDYNVTAIFKGNENYTNSYKYDSFIINNTSPDYSLFANNLVKYYCNDTQYTVKLTDKYGNPIANRTILVTLNCYRWSNLQYNITTNASGVATLRIDLISGFYTITASFENATPVTTNITVLDILETHDVVKYYCNGTQYTVKLTDNKGNPIGNQNILVKVSCSRWSKSVWYTITTNSSGVAVLPINLIAGIYSISATFNKTTKYNNIVVYPTLTANSLVKRISESAVLSARLVDGNGNPVAGKEIKFTVKVKTYNVITDVNGVATLPIGLGLGTWSFLIANPESGATTRATVKVIQ